MRGSRRRIAVAVLGGVIGSLLWAAPASAATVAVKAVDFAFDPDPVEIEAGDTVTWTNSDQEPHTMTADDGSFSLVINPGESASRVFDDEGAVPYYCKFHGGPGGDGMAGTVQVGSVALPDTVHLSGADNVTRSIAWSKLDHPDGAGFAVLGRADGFADSLSSGLAQGTLGAPLLLTAPGALDPRVSTELERLGARVVYLLGGTSALSPAVADSLTAAGYTVRRVAGADRLLTATAVAETFAPEATSAIVVRAFGDGADPTRAFVDALAAGAVAAATGQPVLFSRTAALSEATKTYLQEHPITSVTVVGGTAALSDQVEEDLKAIGVEPERAAGLGRADTARTVSGGIEFDEDADLVIVDGTSADGWVDGFAAAGHQARILLSSGDGLPGATAQELGFQGASNGIVCGTTVTAAACDRSEVVRELDLDIPVLAAFLDDEERGGLAGATAASGLYIGGDGTTVCYDYFGTPLEIVAAHVHLVSDGTAALPMTLDPAADNDSFGCSFGVDPTLVADLQANPADYYINVHTAEYPSGAISGTLTNLDVLGLAGLAGEAEVPGPGDPDAVGFSFMFTTDTPGELCAVIFAFGFSSEPTSAHIHQGASGASGPIALTLVTPVEEESPIHCYDAGEALVSAIRSNPAGYYVNIHTADFPAGAIRGQVAAFS